VSKTRAIRFSENEDKKIEEFLEKNSFFDFSTLARIAILAFLKDPKITILPVKENVVSKDNSSRRNYGRAQ
jgi:hypothetical protein